MDGEIAAGNVITEMMQTHGEVLGAGPQLRFFGYFDTCGFVFEDFAADFRLDKRDRNTAVVQLRKQIHQGDGFCCRCCFFF